MFRLHEYVPGVYVFVNLSCCLYSILNALIGQLLVLLTGFRG